MKKLRLLFIIISGCLIVSCKNDSSRRVENEGEDKSLITTGTGGAEFLVGNWKLTNYRADEGGGIKVFIDDCEQESTLHITLDNYKLVPFFEGGDHGACAEGLINKGEHTVLDNRISFNGKFTLFSFTENVTFTANENSLVLVSVHNTSSKNAVAAAESSIFIEEYTFTRVK